MHSILIDAFDLLLPGKGPADDGKTGDGAGRGAAADCTTGAARVMEILIAAFDRLCLDCLL